MTNKAIGHWGGLLITLVVSLSNDNEMIQQIMYMNFFFLSMAASHTHKSDVVQSPYNFLPSDMILL